MLIGYARISKADGTQVLDRQKDALIAAGVKEKDVYRDEASGKRDERPGLQACLGDPIVNEQKTTRFRIIR